MNQNEISFKNIFKNIKYSVFVSNNINISINELGLAV